jgi:Fe2+ or Zn2+ uptake regulation protein
MGEANEMSVRLDRVLLDQIAGRWQLLILDALCDHGRKARFNALKRAIAGISQKTLTRCLRQLERSGLVARSNKQTSASTLRSRNPHELAVTIHTVNRTSLSLKSIPECRSYCRKKITQNGWARLKMAT